MLTEFRQAGKWAVRVGDQVKVATAVIGQQLGAKMNDRGWKGKVLAIRRSSYCPSGFCAEVTHPSGIIRTIDAARLTRRKT